MISARKIQQMIIKSLFIIPGIIFPNQVRGQGPLYGEDIHVRIMGAVYNVEGITHDEISTAGPQGNVSLTLWIRYTYYDASGYPVMSYKMQSFATGTMGNYDFTFNLGDAVFNIHEVGAEIINRNEWLLKYYNVDKNQDTEYEIDLYVIPSNDFDGNGIRDDFEWDIVKKFCPSLVPNEHSTKLYPEPVEIMGGKYNSKIYATWTVREGRYVSKKYPDFVAVPADSVEVETAPNSNVFHPLIPNYKNEFDKPFNYSFIETDDIKLQPDQRIIKRFGPGPEDYKMYTSVYEHFLWIHLDWPTSNSEAWKGKYIEERNKNHYAHTVYCTIWEESQPSYPFNTYIVAIQYWFFYPYDDWANDHEGDWEHINVIATSQFIDRTYLKSVQFYFHERWMEKNKDVLEVDDESHVTVYIGGESKPPLYARLFNVSYHGWNSGGSYPDAEQWQEVGSAGFGYYYDDRVLGEGPKVYWHEIIGNNKYNPNSTMEYWTDEGTMDYWNFGRGLILLKDATYWQNSGFFDKHPKYSWLKANINIGEPAQEPVTNQFRSYPPPYRKPDWRKLGGFGSYHLYN